VRGYRIELGEIEAVLRQQPGVTDALVLMQERGTEKRLMGYVTCEAVGQTERQGGEKAVGRRIRERVAKQLPDYMVPASVIEIKTWPLTPNGKIDQKALLSAEGGDEERTKGYVGPQTAVEELMSGIWEEVLGVGRGRADDNFFEIGGHSLLATQIVSRVRALFQIEMPLRSLFESPTIAGLSRSVENAIKLGAAQAAAPPIKCVERSDAVPLSFAQQRLWFLDQLMPNSSVYIVPTILKITGQFNLAAFKQSLDEVIRRHETLRTTFAMKEGKPVQVIAPAQSLELPVIDLSDLPLTEREVAVEAYIVEEIQRPFDLTRGPLLRATLLQLGVQEHVLLFAMHHIVSDDWSKGVLIREVAALYEAFSQGLPSPLPERSLQYADFAHWQREWLTGEVLETQLAYWRRQLSGTLTPLELPTDRPRPASPSFRGAHIPVRLSSDLTEKLKKLSRREGATLFMTLLAAFKTLLHRYTSREDIIVGTPIANRTRGEIEDLIGFFVNTLVLRSDFSGNPTFCELLGRMRETTLGAYAHQDLPFEKLVEDLNLSRQLGQTPLLQVVFTLQNAPMPPLELSGMTLEVESVDSGTAKFDLVLNMAETEEGLAGWLEYNRDLFEDATISRMQRHFEKLLASIVEQPEARLDDLEILTDEEMRALEQIVEVSDFEGSFSF
jgi:acyl carrier protein